MRDRLQALWVQNTRNRIVIMVGTAVLAVLLLCGCLNLLGAIGGGLVDSLITDNPSERPTAPVGGTQVANINPTFPLPKPTTYPYPNPPAQNVPSSGTPPPTPTPTPTPTERPTPLGGDPNITYTLAPDPAAFTAGTTNQIILTGPPHAFVSLSIYAVPTCVNMNQRLDENGQATFQCDFPADLKGSKTNMSIQVFNPPGYQQFSDIPIN